MFVEGKKGVISQKGFGENKSHDMILKLRSERKRD